VRNAGRRALVVAELYQGKVMVLEAVRGESAAAVIACLERLVERFEPPLVLKADNGSAFISAELRAFCQRHRIELLHSPVRRPSFNGTAEVCGRWGKVRTEQAARRAKHEHELWPEDLAAAGTFVDDGTRVAPELRDRFDAVFHACLRAVCNEQGLAGTDGLGRSDRASLERVAIQRALVQCHILMIRGRDYRP
jgi:transposase InsO family protein